MLYILTRILLKDRLSGKGKVNYGKHAGERIELHKHPTKEDADRYIKSVLRFLNGVLTRGNRGLFRRDAGHAYPVKGSAAHSARITVKNPQLGYFFKNPDLFSV